MSSSAVRALPFLLGALLSYAAHADVGLLPTVVTGPGLDPAAVARAVTESAAVVLKERLKALPPDALTVFGPGCLEAAPCRARAAGRLGLEELARVDVVGTGLPSPFARAVLTVWAPDGAVAFVDEQALATDRDLRGLLTRAFDPARATARLDITGVLAGEFLLIDGLPSAPEALLAPGAHTLVVVHTDGTRSTETVTLGFEERRTIAVPRRAAPGETAWPPGLLPGVVGGGVAVVGLVGAGVLAGAAVSGRPAERDVAVIGTALCGAVGILGATTAIIALWPASKEPSPPPG